jgi:two-component system phosphate regulon sensor histidine kinase PhoR
MQYNSAGAPTGFICITRDITEHKKAIEAEKQLVMLEKEFISSVSRELRAPLLSLMDHLTRMRTNKMTNFDVLNELLTHASKDSNQLLDMVNELLDFSLLENEDLTLNWEHADLVQVILDVLQSSREQADARRITLMSAPMDTPLFAYVDPARMRRVLLKLVENAMNFSGKDSSVLVTGKSMNGKIIINVIDEGTGISLEDCSRIFDKYYQVDLPQNKNTTGTGVGLYIAKQIAEAHGGTLTMSSQLGAGSTFTLTIPVEKKSNS